MQHRPFPNASILAALAAIVVLGACGDDGEQAAVAATTEPPVATTDDLADYCATAEQLNSQDGPPTAEQLATYAELAPDEVADPTAVVLAAFDAAGGDFGAVFADPEALAAIETLSAFEREACGLGEPVDPSVTQLDPEATRVDVTATDYHFDATFPTTIGRYSFVMTNSGAEPHLLILAHLEDGATIEEVLESEGETGLIASFESEFAAPGSEVVVTADLEPGRWVVVCPIPDAEQVPHLALGMVHEFEIS